jgi:uncharacterized protein (TIRG00374 family)
MADPEELLPSPKIRIWRYLPILIVLGLAVYLLLPQISTLAQSWSVVHNMAWWAVALAICAQILSYLSSGFMLRSILEINQKKLSLWKGALITMASFSMGLVAGWVGGIASTYSWIRRENHDGNTAAMAGTLPALLNNGVLVGVSITGTAYLMLVHDLTNTQLIEFGAVLLVLALISVLILTALHYPTTGIRFSVWVTGRWAALRHKPFNPASTIAFVNQFVAAWNSLGKGKWRRPLLGAIANMGFDMLTLYFLFVAAGNNVSIGVLFAGYGLPIILGKMAFLFPGGVGVIEGTMVALYDSLKVPNSISVVVILAYRLFSFWLPTLLGFVAAAFLSGKFFRTKKNRPE